MLMNKKEKKTKKMIFNRIIKPKVPKDVHEWQGNVTKKEPKCIISMNL